MHQRKRKEAMNERGKKKEKKTQISKKKLGKIDIIVTEIKDPITVD